MINQKGDLRNRECEKWDTRHVHSPSWWYQSSRAPASCPRLHKRDIFQHSVRLDGTVNVGLGLFRQIDRLGIASTLKVENTIVIPSMFVVTNESTVGIGTESRLACSRQTKKESNVAIFAHIGTAVHGKRTLQRQPVVHERKDSLFVLTSVPGAKNDGLFLFHVEHDCRFGMQIVALPVVVDLTAAVDHGKVGLEILEFFFVGGPDEHVGDKVDLPGHFHNESNLLLRLLVGATESVKDVDRVEGVQVVDGLVVEFIKDFRSRGLVDGSPVEIGSGLAALILDNPLVLGRAASVLARVYDKGVAVLGGCHNALIVLLLVFKELLVGEVLVDSGGTGNAESGNARLGTSVGADKGLGHVVVVARVVSFAGHCGLEVDLLLEAGWSLVEERVGE